MLYSVFLSRGYDLIKDNKSVILFTSAVIITLFFGSEFFSSLRVVSFLLGPIIQQLDSYKFGSI